MKITIVEGITEITSDGDIVFNVYGGSAEFNAGQKNQWTAPNTYIGEYEEIEIKENETLLPVEKLLLFFRSTDQAKGLPKAGKTEALVEGNKWKKTENENGYSQEFGFDLFRPNLYGKNTRVYTLNPDGNAVDSTKTIDSYYTIEPSLSMKIVNKKKKLFHIDNEYNFQEDSAKAYYDAYYIPNLLIQKGKNVTVYVKNMCKDDTEYMATINYPSNKGITEVSKNVTFKKSGELQPITISTSPTENIIEPIIITLEVLESDVKKCIGKLRLMPNNEKNAKLNIIDVSYNLTTTTSNNYDSFINELNTKAFNQAAINLEASSKIQSLNISSTTVCITKSNNITQFLDTTGKINNMAGLLSWIKTYYYENLILKLFTEIETNLRKEKIEDEEKKIYPFLLENEKIVDLINENEPDKKSLINLMQRGINFLDSMKYNQYNMFMLKNLVSATETKAMAHINSKCSIITKEALTDVMICAHELAHNFNLGHTFDLPATTTENAQNGNLRLPKLSTRENIMDYMVTGDANRTTFISYQWEFMRESLQSNKELAELNFRSSNDEVNGIKYITYFEKNDDLKWFSHDFQKKLRNILLDKRNPESSGFSEGTYEKLRVILIKSFNTILS